MVVFAVVPTGSLEKRPDGKKAGRVKISVRPRQASPRWPENLKQIGGKISKEQTVSRLYGHKS